MYSYLILGGGSLVGRTLVQYLIQNKLAKEVRVVDRMLKETGYFSPSCLEALKQVEYIQGNLLNPEFVTKVFSKEEGGWDIVVNCALETKFGQPQEIYEDRILKSAINLAQESVNKKAKVFLQLSTYQVYSSKQNPSKETDKFKPKSTLAKFYVEAEEAQSKIEGLNMITLRPAIVYGPGDCQNLTPIFVLARVYQHLNEPMPLLWKKDFKLNTIHSLDAARAIHHTACWYIENNKSGLEYFNLVDEGNTDSAKIESILKDMFSITIESCNSVILSFIKANLDQFLDDANEKHLEPWSELLKEYGIFNSPLIPYMEKENINQIPSWLDGSRISEVTQFKCQVPAISKDLLKKILEEFREMKLWPGEV
ncbi:hypothetical protein DSO57_1037838 [Entomophthora muscae]|uniref:Uncharacterized protein n=1 Tax=Entomophthora muscae TaxID=34485 RepID=A0ACC2TXI4_9FUNG|nr:hypothetical protein DSO57_1037838 [Entomophthora muscae]